MNLDALSEEPLVMLYGMSGFDPALIKRFESGEKYAGIMLNNGNIGVCAVLGQKIDHSLLQGGIPDFTDPGHRIILNAYFNALLNYELPEVSNGDIFSQKRFSRYSEIVMIGSFCSLLDKFRDSSIPVSVFDRLSEEEFLIPMRRQPEFLSKADCVILTGTTISNKSFMEITARTQEGCDIFLLGPSNTIHPSMFGYKNIKVIFGSRFSNKDHRVLDLIRDGHGTKSFLKDINKVYVIRP
ncbi:MAG: DUF364 domain-containing protein [Bacteroidales bacterium]